MPRHPRERVQPDRLNQIVAARESQISPPTRKSLTLNPKSSPLDGGGGSVREKSFSGARRPSPCYQQGCARHLRLDGSRLCNAHTHGVGGLRLSAARTHGAGGLEQRLEVVCGKHARRRRTGDRVCDPRALREWRVRAGGSQACALGDGGSDVIEEFL